MLKPFTVQEQTCPLRAAWRGTQFNGAAVSLHTHTRGSTPAHNRYIIRQEDHVLGLLLGSGWTCDQFAAFVPHETLDPIQARALNLPAGTVEGFNFDHEIRLESAQHLRWLLADLASLGVEKALDAFAEGYGD